MNVVVFLPNWVGDAVMATPTLRALRAQYLRPIRMIGIGPPAALDVLAGNPWLDEQRVYERNPSRPEHGFWAVCRRLRKDRCELAVILPNAPRQAALAWLAGARRRVGYNRHRRGFLLTTRLMPPMKDGAYTPCSTLGYYLALAKASGCRDGSRDMELFTTPDDEAAADAVWSAQGWSPAERVIALNNSGAFGEAKLWPDDYAAQLARTMVDRTDHRVLVLCGPAERDRAADIAAAAGAGVTSLAAHPVSLGLTKACLRRCRALVTTDSGPRHIGAAFGLPVVTLFGPTDEAWTDTGYGRETRVAIDIECRPCQQPICPLGHHRCMRDLTAERVWSSLRPVLEFAP